MYRCIRSGIVRAIDLAMLPVILLAAIPMLLFRRVGAMRLPLARSAFRACGYWPLRRHYYDPLFDPRDLSRPLDAPRSLVAIDWNEQEQLAHLSRMRYQVETRAFVAAPALGELRFRYENSSFLSGDADYLYGFVRTFRPRKVVEVGCGNSTLLIHAAVNVNRSEDPAYNCEHICIEPYEQPWLERLNISILRQRVEHTNLEIFGKLGPGDLLFIDSSHVIRPCGDVLFQVLEVLPRLRSGVYVHFHDIFSPRNYPTEWTESWGYLWNEQYLIEAFLSFNRDFRIVAALNYLQHHHYDALAAICVDHKRTLEPGSLYLQRA